jgi:hypothetical protein
MMGMIANSKAVSGPVAVRFPHILLTPGAKNVGMNADVAGLKARSTRPIRLMMKFRNSGRRLSACAT